MTAIARSDLGTDAAHASESTGGGSPTRRIFVNALSLFGTTVATSGSGFVFWWAAAHFWSRTVVGAGGAALSALQLIATAGMLGLGTLLVGELSKRESNGPALTSTALLAALVAGSSFAILYVVGLSIASVANATLPPGPIGVGCFVLATGVTAALLVFDDATVGFGRAQWQLWRNTVFGVAKLAVLPAVALGLELHGVTGVVAAWLVGAATSVLLLGLLTRSHLWREIGRPRLALIREHGFAAIVHHFLNISSAAPKLLLPVFVASFLTPATNASFYAALLLIGFPYIVPTHLSTALFSVGSGDRTALRQVLGRALLVLVLTAIATGFGCVLLGGFMLSLFGHGYRSATTALIILGFATFQSGVKSIYIAVCRVNGDLTRCAQVAFVGTAAEVAAPILALSLGANLAMTALAWAIVMSAEGAVCWPAVAAAWRPKIGALSLAFRWTAPHTLSSPENRFSMQAPTLAPEMTLRR